MLKKDLKLKIFIFTCLLFLPLLKAKADVFYDDFENYICADNTYFLGCTNYKWEPVATPWNWSYLTYNSKDGKGMYLYPNTIAMNNSFYSGLGNIPEYGRVDLKFDEAPLIASSTLGFTFEYYNGGSYDWKGKVYYGYDHTLFYNDGFSDTILALEVQPDTWQRVQWLYSIGSNTIKFKINAGAWTTSLPLRLSSTNHISAFNFQNEAGSANRLDVDNVYMGDSAPNYISIDSPKNLGIYKDFGFWQIDYHTMNVEDYYVAIKYGTTTVMNDWLDSNIVQYSSDDVRWTVEKSHIIGNGDYYAQAYLMTNSGIVATSSQISFTVDNVNGGSIFGSYSGTSTAGSLDTAHCDPNSNFFSYSLCSLGVFLFVPDQSIVSKYTEFGELFRKKPPYGYIDQVRLKLAGLTTTSTPILTSYGTTANDLIDLLKSLMDIPIFLLPLVVFYRGVKSMQI